MDKIQEIQKEIARMQEKQSISMQDVQTLSACWGALQALKMAEERENDTELTDVFPTLCECKKEHSVANFKALCVEIEQFCREVYASTTCAHERDIYNEMVRRLL